MLSKISQIPCQTILSGGQTGVDRGALDACLKYNFPCGGWCPKGRLAEDGRIKEHYPLKESPSRDYAHRTRMNVMEANGTLILLRDQLSGGTEYTSACTKNLRKPLMILTLPEILSKDSIPLVIKWLSRENIKLLNVAGPRSSEWKDAYELSFDFISSLIYVINNS